MAIHLIQKLVAILAWFILVFGLAAKTSGEDASKTKQRNVESHIESRTKPYFTTNVLTNYANTRLREGEKVSDMIGEFQKSGDRYTFSTEDSKTTIRVLENLSLERVARSLEDDPTSRLWSASGVITEFRGENYLLLSRAVLKPRAKLPPRTPATEEKKKE